MDDTIDRIKLKNDELKQELRLLIAQDSPIKNGTLSPLDMNKSYESTKKLDTEKGRPRPPIVETVGDEKRTSPLKFSSNFNTLKPESGPVRQTQNHINGVSHSINPVSSIPSTKPAEPQNDIFKERKVPSARAESTRAEFPLARAESTRAEITRTKESPLTKAKEDNLLLTKVLNQDQQISDLKEIISQLKRDNSQLQQQVYQQPIIINQIKRENEYRIKDLTDKYHQQLENYTSINNQLMTKITNLTNENHHLQQDCQEIVSQLNELQQDYNLLLQDENSYKSTEEEHYNHIKNYQTYLRVNNRLIQNDIINKFVDKCDQIGLLIDNDLNFNQVSPVQGDDDDTGKLLGDNNTTNKLLLQKHYPSISQLMVNSSIKANRWRVVAKFLIAVNRFTNSGKKVRG